jgi:hypothetical protein
VYDAPAQRTPQCCRCLFAKRWSAFSFSATAAATYVRLSVSFLGVSCFVNLPAQSTSYKAAHAFMLVWISASVLQQQYTSHCTQHQAIKARPPRVLPSHIASRKCMRVQAGASAESATTTKCDLLQSLTTVHTPVVHMHACGYLCSSAKAHTPRNASSCAAATKT